MPADRQKLAGGFARHQLPAGSYRKLLRDQCEQRCKPDPRLLFFDEANFDALKAAGAARAVEVFDELRAAGEPITVPTGHVGAHPSDGPEWLTVPAIYGGASLTRVYRDDVAEPAEFYGDMSGQVYERIPVPPRHRP